MACRLRSPISARGLGSPSSQQRPTTPWQPVASRIERLDGSPNPDRFLPPAVPDACLREVYFLTGETVSMPGQGGGEPTNRNRLVHRKRLPLRPWIRFCEYVQPTHTSARRSGVLRSQVYSIGECPSLPRGLEERRFDHRLVPRPEDGDGGRVVPE